MNFKFEKVEANEFPGVHFVHSTQVVVKFQFLCFFLSHLNHIFAGVRIFAAFQLVVLFLFYYFFQNVFKMRLTRVVVCSYVDHLSSVF